MKQLLLDINDAVPVTLQSFIVGCNQQALQLLRQLTRPESGHFLPPEERMLYLWGQHGAGKTHICQALSHAPQTLLLTPDSPLELLEYLPGTAGYLVDNVHEFNPEAQISLFNLYNNVREQGGWLVATGSTAPAQLQQKVREDLRTRLGWGLVFELHGLTDEEKIAALTQSAASRHIPVGAGVLPYLITHTRRDMQSLSDLLTALDHFSLETKRPITLPLLRSMLQSDTEQSST